MKAPKFCVLASLLFFTFATAQLHPPGSTTAVVAALDDEEKNWNVATLWNSAHLDIMAMMSTVVPTTAARNIFLLQTAMWNSMVPYTDTMHPTVPLPMMISRVPLLGRTERFINVTVSYAAYRTLKYMYSFNSSLTADIDMLFSETLGLNTNFVEMSMVSPASIGNMVSYEIIQLAANDQSNDFNHKPGTVISPNVPAFADYTGYVPVNNPRRMSRPTQQCAPMSAGGTLRSINHWEPLSFGIPSTQLQTQSFMTPFWDRVIPFAIRLDDPIFSTAAPPPMLGTNTQQQFIGNHSQILALSADLDDFKKATAEFWAGSISIGGDLNLQTVRIAFQRQLSLLDTVKLLFLSASSIYDSSIVAFHMKRYFDSARPITAIHCLRSGELIEGWSTPYRGVTRMPAQEWRPYQAGGVTPGSPGYVSIHAMFCNSHFENLRRFFGSDLWGAAHTIKAGDSYIEPMKVLGEAGFIEGVTDVPNVGSHSIGYSPAKDVTLQFLTFTDAADSCGLSNLYGGIHILADVDAGRFMASEVSRSVWEKYNYLLSVL
jgi:hypothetical protein